MEYSRIKITISMFRKTCMISLIFLTAFPLYSFDLSAFTYVALHLSTSGAASVSHLQATFLYFPSFFVRWKSGIPFDQSFPIIGASGSSQTASMPRVRAMNREPDMSSFIILLGSHLSDLPDSEMGFVRGNDND